MTRNWSTKLLALLLALVVYAHVQTEKEREQDFRIPLRFVGLPESLMLSGGVPRHAAVRLRGTGKQLLKLKVQPPEAFVDLRSARPGVIQRMLSATDVVLPVGANAQVAEILEPALVELVVDTLVQRTMPVRATWEGRPPNALAVARPIEVDPPHVDVVGPARVLEERSALETLPIHLGDARNREWSGVLLDLPPGVRGLGSEAVRVRVTWAPAAHRTFAVSVTADGVPPGWSATIQPPRVDVQVAGPESLLATVSPESVRAMVTLEEVAAGGKSLAPAVQVPFEPRLRVVKTRPGKVLLRVFPPGSRGGGTGN